MRLVSPIFAKQKILDNTCSAHHFVGYWALCTNLISDGQRIYGQYSIADFELLSGRRTRLKRRDEDAARPLPDAHS